MTFIRPYCKDFRRVFSLLISFHLLVCITPKSLLAQSGEDYRRFKTFGWMAVSVNAGPFGWDNASLSEEHEIQRYVYAQLDTLGYTFDPRVREWIHVEINLFDNEDITDEVLALAIRVTPMVQTSTYKMHGVEIAVLPEIVTGYHGQYALIRKGDFQSFIELLDRAVLWFHSAWSDFIQTEFIENK